MKYLTKEWYAAMQLIRREGMYREIPDADYSDEEINGFIQKRLSEDASFKDTYNSFMQNIADFSPKWLKEVVDLRLIALGMLPSFAYKRLAAEIDGARKDCMAGENQFNEATSLQRLPAIFMKSFTIHDAKLFFMGKSGNKIVMTFDLSYGSRTIQFLDATVITDELPASMDVRFLYNEIYRVGLNFEIHMLFEGKEGELFYYTLQCSDIATE